MTAYTRTDQQLHVLCQLIAKANRNYVPAKEDDSHTNLYFDNLGNRITGRWIDSKEGAILMCLNLKEQVFEFINQSATVIDSVSIINRSITDIEVQIESILPSLGFDPSGFRTDLHFEIPRYHFAEHPMEPFDQNGLQSWIKYRAMANTVCWQLMGYAQVIMEIRIWPHHFDTGIYFRAKKDLGIGFGLAMEDEMAGAPYFYLTAYPDDGEIQYANLPEAAGWRWQISDQWKGAILPLSVLENQSIIETNNLLNNYITTVYKWIVAQ